MKQDSKKTTKKRTIITCIVAAAIVAIFLIAYNLYRYPAALRHLSDNSLNESSTDTTEVENEDAVVEADSTYETESSTEPETGSDEAAGNVLVAYFTWSGNTADMASYISEQTGGDLLELQPLNPYPDDYSETGDVAKTERDENARPEIANLPESLDGYDTIFIGYPIWWHTAPMIIGTFLESYDLTGIDVYPFTQSASMDTEQFSNSMDFVRENAQRANVHDGLFVRASDTEGILDYLSENGFIK